MRNALSEAPPERVGECRLTASARPFDDQYRVSQALCGPALLFTLHVPADELHRPPVPESFPALDHGVVLVDVTGTQFRFGG
ncbi:hypothetical protein GCM10023192_08250 [Amycolatopsis samaneae]